MSAFMVSIIIPTSNEGAMVKSTLASLIAAETHLSYEVIVVDDGSVDGSCDFLLSEQWDNVRLVRTADAGVARARNLGAVHAEGEYLIFCDAHLEFEDGWMDKLVIAMVDGSADAISPAIADMNYPDRIGYGLTLNEQLVVVWGSKPVESIVPSAILPGGCLAIRREIFEHVGQFEQGFRTWGYDDIELSIKLWLFGYRCMLRADVVIQHLFRSVLPYSIQYSVLYYNMLRMAYLHFDDRRIEQCKQLIVYADPDDIEKEVLLGKAHEIGQQYRSMRKYDDMWFMNKFQIPF